MHLGSELVRDTDSSKIVWTEACLIAFVTGSEAEFVKPDTSASIEVGIGCIQVMVDVHVEAQSQIDERADLVVDEVHTEGRIDGQDE